MSLLRQVFDQTNNQLRHRPEQVAYAHAVGEILQQNHQRVGLLQAETGIGKTLGYLIPATDRCDNGEGVVIATHTLHLIRQIVEVEAPKINAWREKAGMRPIAFGTYYGMANYLNVARAEAIHDTTVGSESKKYLRNLIGWGKSFERPPLMLEYFEQFGFPPSGISEFALGVHYTDEEASLVREQRVSVGDVDVLVTTHAALITDTKANVFGKEEDGKLLNLIVDEADNLPSAFTESCFKSVNLRHLQRHMQSEGASTRVMTTIGNVIDDVVAAGRFIDHPVMSFDGDLVAHLETARMDLRRCLQGFATDDKLLMDDLSALDTASEFNVIGFGFTPVRKEARFVRFNPTAPRLFGSYASRHYRSTVLTSATLSVDANVTAGTKWLVSALNLNSDRLRCEAYAPNDYGRLSVCLATEFPEPMKKHGDTKKLNPEWLQKTAEYISTLDGNVVVMTTSFQETQELAAQIKGQRAVWEHQQGSKISETMVGFMDVGGVLITPSGGVGLSFRKDGHQVAQHFVITRIPFTNPSGEMQAALQAYGRHRHNLQPGVQFLIAINDAIRDMRQRIGRTIRDASDVSTIHIMDPRFPAFNAPELNRMAKLKSAIPTRFTAAYRKANTIGTTQSEEIFW